MKYYTTSMIGDQFLFPHMRKGLSTKLQVRGCTVTVDRTLGHPIKETVLT